MMYYVYIYIFRYSPFIHLYTLCNPGSQCVHEIGTAPWNMMELGKGPNIIEHRTSRVIIKSMDTQLLFIELILFSNKDRADKASSGNINRCRRAMADHLPRLWSWLHCRRGLHQRSREMCSFATWKKSETSMGGWCGGFHKWMVYNGKSYSNRWFRGTKMQNSEMRWDILQHFSGSCMILQQTLYIYFPPDRKPFP